MRNLDKKIQKYKWSTIFHLYLKPINKEKFNRYLEDAGKKIEAFIEEQFPQDDACERVTQTYALYMAGFR